MKKLLFFNVSFLLFSLAATCQAVDTSVTASPSDTTKNLFDDDRILDISLKGDIHKLLNDRTGEAKYYPVLLTYQEKDGVISIPINVKTRGHFRRDKANCSFPPLLLTFSDTLPDLHLVFPKHSSLKLVMPCNGDKYVIHEWLVYKLYNLVTPQSFRARLVKVTLEDEGHKKMPSPFYGMLLEDEKQMAKRNHFITIKKKMRPSETMRAAFLRMAVFEYLIGNTDWSVDYLQNIKLISADHASAPITVPYDFDLSGIVNAPYALPAPELKMNSVRERRYRGYCIQDMQIFDSTIALYNSLRKKIYSLYEDCQLLDDKYKKQTVSYIDEFYSTINNQKKLQKEFAYPCIPGGTGNVIIKGLREN